MSNIDKRALREAAEKATKGQWAVEFDDEIYSTDGVNHEQIAMVFSENEACDAAFIAAANPIAVLALLDELEAADNTVAQLNNEICNLLPGVQYMDPPDGGSVTPIEQVQRMVVDYREQMEAAEKTSAARLEAIDRTHKMFQREKDRADAAEKRNAEMESLLSAIGKSRPGGAYFCKWDGKINEVLNHGK